LLRQAREHLEAAIELRPAHAKSQALLGYTFDALGRAQQALACMREARRLKPGERIYDVYVPTLLAGSGREKEALAEIKAVARRQKVDIAAIERGFKEAGWPRPKAADYLRNGFVHARNFLESSIKSSRRIMYLALGVEEIR
jgi:tetratricopeptide (TPR) repeat protein